MSVDREPYYAQATTWAVDQQVMLRRHLRITQMFALALILIAILEALALLLLVPLKTIRPIPILVDRQTGYVETLRDDGRREIRADAALEQSLLAQYVVARESYHIDAIRSDYQKVALWSDGDARRQFLTFMAPSNPNSPLRLYPRTASVDVAIRSVSMLGPSQAWVRFDVKQQDQDTQPIITKSWNAFLSFQFVDEPMTAEDRLANPLGFKVVRYRKDPEFAPPELKAARSDMAPFAAVGTAQQGAVARSEKAPSSAMSVRP